MPIERAHEEFKRAMRDPLNLATIHRERRPAPREYGSINRAIVVFTVAAWQAFVEALAMQILDEIRIPAGEDGYARHRDRRADVISACHRFSTPNAEGVQDLLVRVGFDPWPHWTWVWSRTRVSAADARDMMNAWLRVRHAIAHGDAEVPREKALWPTRSEAFVLNLPNANRCMKFFTWVADQTTAAAIAEFESAERASAWLRANPRYVDPKAAQRQMLPTQTRTCQNCGRAFTPEWGAQAYCSDACSETSRRERWRRQWERRGEPLPEPEQERTCPICENVFVPRNSRQVYCSVPCRRDAERQRRGWKRRAAPRA